MIVSSPFPDKHGTQNKTKNKKKLFKMKLISFYCGYSDFSGEM